MGGGQGCHTRAWVRGGQSLGCGELMAPIAQPRLNQDNCGTNRLDVAPLPMAGAPTLLLWPRWPCHLQGIRLAGCVWKVLWM